MTLKERTPELAVIFDILGMDLESIIPLKVRIRPRAYEPALVVRLDDNDDIVIEQEMESSYE
jgi:hypothetical protein